MIKRLVLLFSDSLIKKTLVIFLLSILVFIIISILKWSTLPREIPLFYSRPRSADQLGSNYQIILLPFFSLIFYSINAIIASYLYRVEKAGAYILTIGSTVVSLILLLTFLKIIWLVT